MVLAQAKRLIQKYWLGREKIDLNLGSGSTPYGRVRLDARLMENVNLVGDARKLPFRDGSFNNVLAADILEHFYPDEWAAIVREWLRVARKQLVIEVPNYHSLSVFFSLLYASFGVDHFWLESHLLGGPPGEYFGFHKSLIMYGSLKKFLKGLQAKEHFSFKIRGKFLDLFGNRFLGILTLLLGIDRFFPRCAQKFLIVINKGQAGQERHDVFSALICPECRNELNRAGNYLKCQNCSAEYPVVNGVPIMMTEGNEHYWRHSNNVKQMGAVKG